MARTIPPASITWTNRAKMSSFQKGCGFLGYVLIFVQILIAIVIIAGKNSTLNPSAASAVPHECTGGYVPYSVWCVSPDLIDEFNRLQASGECNTWSWFDRRMEETSPGVPPVKLFEDYEQAEVSRLHRRLEENTDTMWDRFAQNPEIATVLPALVIVVGFLWIFVMNKCALACIIFSIGVAVLFFIFMSILPILVEVAICTYEGGKQRLVADDKLGRQRCENEGGTFGHVKGKFQWIFLIPAAVIVLICIIVHKKISVAAKCLSKCCLSLQKRPSIIGACLGVFAGFVMYIGFWIGFAMSFFSNMEARCDRHSGAVIVIKENNTLMKIMGILCPFSYIYFEMLTIVVTAAGVGGWYFQDNAPKTPALVGLKWAYTSSSGAAFLSTIITWPIMLVRGYVHGWASKVSWCVCFPWAWLYWVVYILWCCVLRSYLAFTRFMLISHTFHGGDLFSTARNAWGVLKKHLGGAVVNSTVADYVVNFGVWSLSLIFAFGAWVWMEKAMSAGFLQEIFTAVDGGADKIILVLFLMSVVSWFCYHSLFTIILTAILANLVKGSDTTTDIHPLLCGIFVGAISNIIFSFLAKIIHAGMDTIFYCFALEAENAHLQAEHGELHQFIKAEIYKNLPGYMKKEDMDNNDNDYPPQDGSQLAPIQMVHQEFGQVIQQGNVIPQGTVVVSAAGFNGTNVRNV